MKLAKIVVTVFCLYALLTGCATNTDEPPICGTYTVSDDVVSVMGEYSEGLMPVTVQTNDNLDRERLDGYLSIDGSIAIEPQFIRASRFSNGLAAVCAKNGRYGYIDKNGTFIIPPIYINADNFTDSGYAVVMADEESYFIIDRKNKPVRTAGYIWSIEKTEAGKTYFYMHDPDAGSELLDDKLNVVISKEHGYENIYCFDLDSTLFSVTKNGLNGLYDVAAKKEILPPVYVQFDVVGDKYIITIDRSGEIAVHDITGKMLFVGPTVEQSDFVYTDEYYSYIEPDRFLFTELDGDTQKSVLKDEKGNAIKNFDMQLYSYGSEGNVVYTETENGIRCGLLKPDGNFLFEPEFQSISSTKNGVYLCAKPNEQYTQYVYGADGTLLKTFSDATHIYSNGKNYVLLRLDAKTVILDKDFAEIETFDCLETNTEQVMFGAEDEKKKLVLTDVPSKNAKENNDKFKPIEYTQPLVDTVVFKNNSDRYYKNGRVQIAYNGVNINDSMLTEDLHGAAGVVCDYPWNGNNAVILTTGNSGIIYDMQTNEGSVWIIDAQNNVTEAEITTDSALVMSDLSINLKLLAEITGCIYEDEDGYIYLSQKQVSEEEKKTAREALTGGNISFEDYPVIDGSTATIPFSQKLTAELVGVDEKEAERLTDHYTTYFAYERLIDGMADIIFVTQPSPDELALAKSKGVELEVIPFSKEAFVFLTHVDNPVSSLTVRQIQGIYTGEITNWREVGGNDEPIVAYQRAQNSGSQTIMEAEVMNGLTMSEPPHELLIADMGGLVDSVADYENGKNSIGYNMFIFVRDMYQNNEVKLFAVDGVAPTNETVADGTYPYTVNYYIVFRSDEPENSVVRRLADYVLSSDGQAIVEDSGLVKMN